MRRLIFACTILLGTAGLFAGVPKHAAAQTAPPAALVIQGGTLIDGNGGAPLQNAVVVIEGNRIAQVGAAGAVTIPAGAQIVHADGKFILPGLWDSQTNYAWFWGELDLNQGITSIVDIGLSAEVSVPHRDAVAHGYIRGPRVNTAIANLGGVPPGFLTGYETPFNRADIKTLDELKARIGRNLAAGADMIIFQTGEFPPDWVQAGFAMAHEAGKPGFIRASGPKTDLRAAVSAGADWIPHSIGVSAAIAKDGTRTNNELERFAAMDDSKAADLIPFLVQHHVNLVPTIMHYSAGYTRDWAREVAETEKVFSNSVLLSYYDPGFLATMKRRLATNDQGEVRARRAAGYQNLLRFYRMFDAAGGHTISAGDTNAQKNPGLIIHDEMEALQEAGLPAMHIIQSATLWPAQGMRVADKIGSIEPGKIADIIVVDADPLQDVANLRKISTLIFDGKVTDRGFHPWYATAFMNVPVARSQVVEDLDWARALKQATYHPRAGANAGANAGPANGPDPATSPQPAIETVSPVILTAGSPATTLKLTGFNFVRRSRVLVDGKAVPYTRIGDTELDLALDENMLKRAGRYDIVVRNPAPLDDPKWGNGVSNLAHLIVNFKY